MKIGYENRTCCVAGQVGIWKILVFGSKNQTQISEKLIFGPVKTGPKKLETKIGKNIRFEGILRRERVCCSEHGATAWPILHTASTLRSL